MGYPGMESFAYVAYAEFFVLALLISGVSGVSASLILKLRVRGTAIARDAFLGAIVSVIAFYALWHLGFQYNFIAAIIVAVVLPALYELNRSRVSAPRIK
jgi:hypothetical protein